MNGVPIDLLESMGDRLAFVTGDRVEQEVDLGAAGIIENVAGDLGTGDGLNSKLFTEFTDEGLLRGLSRLDFAAGELPLEGVAIRFTTLADEHLAAPDDYASGYYQGPPLSRHVCLPGRL